MPHEKLNNIVQDKLDKLEELPEGISFNAATVWNKLECQLSDRKEGDRKWQWYVAAAVLLFTLVSIYLIIDNRIVTGVLVNQAKPAIPFTKQQKNIEIPYSLPEKVSAVVPTAKHYGLGPTKKESKIVAQTRENVHFTNLNKPDTIIAITPAVETTLVIKKTSDANKPLLKRKFKVVHVNEVDESPSTDNLASRNNDNSKPAFFNFTFRSNNSSKETGTPPSPPEKEGGLFKAIIN